MDGFQDKSAGCETSRYTTLAEIVGAFPQRGSQCALKYFNGFRVFAHSYADLHDLILRCAAWLRLHGISKGERALIWAPNSPEWVVVFGACAISGAVLVPLDARHRAGFVEQVAWETGARLMIRSRQAPVANLGIPSLPVESLFHELRRVPPLKDTIDVGPDDWLEIVYTSGTTGRPKGVILTHGNVSANVTGALDALKPDPSYHLLSVLPLSHLLEQTGGLWTLLAAGGSILYLRALKPSALLEAFRRESITAMIVVPRLLALLKSRIESEFERRGMSWYLQGGLRAARRLGRPWRKLLFYPVHRRFNTGFHFFICGGAALDPAVEDFWEAIGFEALQGYGLTETSPILTVSRPGRSRIGSVGFPLDRVEIRLGEGNEIRARGPNVFQGYYKQPEATQAAFEGGWYKTGDVGEFDGDGFLYVRGRKKDVIVTSDGLNIYPEDIEQVLNAAPGVKESCVMGAGENQDQVHAALLLQDGNVDPRQCIRQANSLLPPEQQIAQFTVWPEEEFPKTTTLKIKRAEVRERIASAGPMRVAGLPSDRKPDLSVTSLEGMLAEASGAPVEDLRPESRLGQDLGLTSIEIMELVLRLEEEFRTDISDDLVTSETTVGQLKGIIESRQPTSTDQEFRRWTRARPFQLLRGVFEWVVMRPLLRAFCQVHCTGLENVATLQSPCLIVSNHTSHVDTPLIQTRLPSRIGRRTCPAAWKEYFDGRGRPLHVKAALRLAWEMTTIFLNIFPFPQTSGYRRSMAYAGELADAGWSVLFFPEGARRQDGELGEFYSGVGVMARNLRLPILPVAVRGGEKVLPRGRAIPRRGPVWIAFGKPFSPEEDSSEAMARRIHQEVRRTWEELGAKMA
ncbi:MAG TPA: AMP-binding protein [Sumerlaeia bacterium]|nr:AMP-binding protein [Sumerlaeia bacterium]